MKSFKKIIFIVLCFVFSVNVFAQTNFIRIENNNFQNGILNFRPYSVNYVVGIFQNCETSNYYVGPSPQYSIKWGYPHTNWLNTIYTCDFGRNNYSSTDEQGIALQKLNDDLTYLKDNGFNVVRIADINPKVDLLTNQVIIPTGSYSSYFSLVDNLLSIINENGLKAIINLGIIQI